MGIEEDILRATAAEEPEMAPGPAIAPMSRQIAWLRFAPILLLLFCGTWQPIGPGDMWAHAAVGRWMLQHHQIPTHTLFLWTANSDWIAHSWGTELLTYWLIKDQTPYWAITRALLATTALAGLSFGLIWHQWRRENVVGAAALVIFGIAVIASRARLQPRTELVSAVIYAVLLLLVSRIETASPADRKRQLAAAATIPLLVIAWVNLHGMFAFGVVILAIAAFGSLVTTRFSYTTKLLVGVIVASMVASLVNPYGTHLWKALTAIRSKTFEFIIEWEPFWKVPHVSWIDLSYLVVLLAITVTVFALSRKRRVSQILWVAAVVVFYLGARRWAMFLSMTCLWVIGSNLAHIVWPASWKRVIASWLSGVDATPKRWRKLGVAMTVLALAGWTLFLWPSGDGTLLANPVADVLPVGQSDFLVKHHVTGRIFNDYDNAPYLEWRLTGDQSLSIDTLNAYPDSVPVLNNAVQGLQPAGLEVLKTVNCVVGRRPRSFDTGVPPLYLALHFSPYWIESFPGKSAGPVWLRLPPGQVRHRANPSWFVNKEVSVPASPGS